MTFIAPLLLSAQVLLAHRGGAPVTASAPALPQGGIYLWWVASDLANGNVTAWVDRVHGITFTNSAPNPLPVKSDNYVLWDGTASGLVISNSTILDITGGFMSLVIIASPDPTGSKTGPQTFWSNGASAPSLYFNYNHTNTLAQFNFSTDSTVVTNLYTSAYGTNDIVTRYVSGVTPPLTWYSWLNGIANYTNTDIGGLSGVNIFGGRVSAGAVNPLRAKVYEVIVYTNLASADVAGIHVYATNTYKYSP